MSLTRRALQNTAGGLGALKRVFLPSGAGDPWAIPSNGSLAAFASSGVPVTEETAMQLLAVAACVRLLSTTVGGLPFDAVEMQGAIRRTLEPPPYIISDPFGGANDLRWPTRRTGFVQMMVSLLLRGNAYAVVTGRDELLRPARIAVIHPDRVSVGVDRNGARYYEINRRPWPAHDMVHLVGMSMPEAPIGLSVISYARQSIGLGLAAEEFGARFFGNGAHLSGVIEIPGDLDQERARRLKENFQATHGGLRNSHTVGVLTGGAKWAPISISPEDAQFLGTRAAQNLDIAMLFGVPPHMLGQVDRTTSWGCLPGDSMVATTTGSVPIEDVKVGDEVWSYSHDAGLLPAEVVGWQMTGYKPLLTIRTTSRELRLTSNHRVPVRRRTDDGWATVELSASEIRVGDRLLVPSGSEVSTDGGEDDGNDLHLVDSGGCSGPEHLELQRARADGPSAGWSHSDIDLQEVIAIESGDLAVPVYDITVGDHHHFVADGVIVHNTGIEQQTLGFLKYTLSNWIGIFEETWSAMLPPPQVARFNVNGLLRTDTAGRFAVYTQARNSGLMLIDEIRALEDMPPLPDGRGQDPFQPLNSAHSGADAAAPTDPGAASAKSDAESGNEP